jgi:ectoine hydrolase
VIKGPFAADEYESRVARAREAGGKLGVDLLVVTDPRNLCYLTGYDADSYYVPQALLVPTGSEPVTLILRALDIACAHWTTHLSEGQIVGYPDHYVNGPVHAMAFVAEVIQRQGLARRRVGVEPDGMGLTPKAQQTLQESLPTTEFVDSNKLVEWLRTIKSPGEIAVMREAGRISDHAMRVAYDAVAPGVHEAEVAATLAAEMIRGPEGLFGSTAKRPAMGSGPRTDAPHLGWFDASYESDRAVMFELGGHRHNYAVGLSRTIYLGTPPVSYSEFGEAAEEGLNAALPALRAGSRACDVDWAWRAVTEPRGYSKPARIGYSIGLSLPGASWIDGSVSLAPDDETVLEPGMTIHLMVAVWKHHIGYALSETFLIQDGEPESFSQLPRSLYVKA